ncbi:MAG: plastocyanin/azurin family copper-binding protein [Phycisphaerales bacterium]|nr:plastocyanin/azurin family copper-binding protein [Phycisphaerales bacterium]
MNMIHTIIATTLILSAAANADTYTIYANSMSFSPNTVTVHPGDTITWQYNTGYPHTVTSGTDCVADGLFDSPLNSGSPTFTWNVPSDADGDIPYFCQPHCSSGMTGVITVEELPNPCPADVDGDGTVNVNDVLAVIGDWGPCSGCDTDTNDDSVVNVNDILAVIAAWGPCN